MQGSVIERKIKFKQLLRNQIYQKDVIKYDISALKWVPDDNK